MTRTRRLDNEEILEALSEDGKVNTAITDYLRGLILWGPSRVSTANLESVIEHRLNVISTREIEEEECMDGEYPYGAA